MATNSGYRQYHNFDRSREHFNKRKMEVREAEDFDIWCTYGINMPDWELIRKCVLHTFGCSIAAQLLDEHIEPANDLAILITDHMIDANLKAMRDIAKLKEKKDEKC